LAFVDVYAEQTTDGAGCWDKLLIPETRPSSWVATAKDGNEENGVIIPDASQSSASSQRAGLH
jgi:hypothetical protein